jgi:PAS domain S-box-containing protein
MHRDRSADVRADPAREASALRADAAPLLACDAHRRVLVANGAAEQLLGRSSAELHGQALEALSPDFARARTAAEIGVLMQRPGAWGTVEVVHGELGGRLRLEVACRPRPGAGGHVVALRAPVAAPDAEPILTNREREVLSRVADGRTGAEVAEELFLSQATVERHVAAALRKLGAKNRPHGIAIALRTGVLERPGGDGPTGSAAGEDSSYALLVQTLEGLDDPAAVLDPAGEVLIVNEAWRAFGGANARAGVQAEGNYLAVCDAATGCDDARRAAWGIRELLDGRSQSFTMEYRCDAPGLPRWFELRAVRYHGGTAGAAVLVRHRDLTGQRRAENDARVGQTVLDGVGAATVVYSPDGIVTAWMAGAEALMGWTATQAIGQPVWDLFMPRRDRARGEAVVEEARRYGRWSGEMELEREDGSTFQADVRIRALVDADGDITGIIGVVVDIDEQQRARRAATEVTARLQAFADAARDGWISGDASGRITQVNAATEELLGRGAADLVGRHVDTVVAAPTPLRPLSRPSGRGPRDVHEECLLAADGREVPITYRVTRFSTGEGLEQWAVVFRPAG